MLTETETRNSYQVHPPYLLTQEICCSKVVASRNYLPHTSECNLAGMRREMLFEFLKLEIRTRRNNGTQLITPPRNRGGVIFSLQLVCLSVCVCGCVCVCVCVCLMFSCEQNSSRTNVPIWTRFSL